VEKLKPVLNPEAIPSDEFFEPKVEPPTEQNSFQQVKPLEFDELTQNVEQPSEF